MATVLRLQHTSIPMPAGGQEAARRFFGEVLGMAEAPPPSTLDVANLVWFQAGDEGHEVHLFVDDAISRRSNAQHLCLQVDDLAAIRERLAAHGVEAADPEPIHNRPRIFVHDPFGNLIELTEITGDYA